MIQILTTLLVYAIPSVLAITLHESAHAYAARCFGDSTAYRLGRLSINPLHHIDPVGTILVPGLLLLSSLLTGMGGILFGWAKPVPVNFAMLRNPKRDMIWVALAGPACNLIQAICWTLLLRLMLFLTHDSTVLNLGVSFVHAGISVNLMLMAFNLIPILPLDGGRILTGLLPWRWAYEFSKLERYGLAIMLVLIATGATTFFIRPFLEVGRFMVRLVL